MPPILPTILAVPFALCASIPQPVRAQQANTSPASVQAGGYVLEPNHTQVGFRVKHMGFSFYDGRFSGASGALTLDPAKPGSSTVTISVPVASVSTTSAKLDGELKDADWLDAKAFPTMTFKSTAVAPVDGDKAKVTGDLTLHGVTKPVTLDVRFVGSGVNPLDKKYTAGFAIEGDIQRSAFGITKYVPLIGDAVHLTINGAFEKK